MPSTCSTRQGWPTSGSCSTCTTSGTTRRSSTSSVAPRTGSPASTSPTGRRSASRTDRVLPGEGISHTKELVDALALSGWDGYLDVEIFSEPDRFWGLPVDEAARRAHAALVSAADLEALARPRRTLAAVRSDLPTGTVTFLFTDVEGSTRLLHRLGPGRLRKRACGAPSRAARGIRGTWRCRGRHAGRCLLRRLPNCVGAPQPRSPCHAALDGGPIRVRMGLHTGTPTVTDEGYVGIDVHRAARIAALAHGGQTLLSETAGAARSTPSRSPTSAAIA